MRQEIFCPEPTPDGKGNPLVPYSVATHNCEIQVLQPRHENQYAVFVVTESEAITYNYERNHQDPRVAHTLNIEVDPYGNVLESASVVYGRLKMPDEPELQVMDKTDPKQIECIEKTIASQRQTHIIYTQNDFTIDNQQQITSYRLPVTWQTCTYELNGIEKSKQDLLLFSCSSFPVKKKTMLLNLYALLIKVKHQTLQVASPVNMPQ